MLINSNIVKSEDENISVQLTVAAMSLHILLAIAISFLFIPDRPNYTLYQLFLVGFLWAYGLVTFALTQMLLQDTQNPTPRPTNSPTSAKPTVEGKSTSKPGPEIRNGRCKNYDQNLGKFQNYEKCIEKARTLLS